MIRSSRPPITASRSCRPGWTFCSTRPVAVSTTCTRPSTGKPSSGGTGSGPATPPSIRRACRAGGCRAGPGCRRAGRCARRAGRRSTVAVVPRGSQALSVQSVASAQRTSRSVLRYVQTATAPVVPAADRPGGRVEQLVPLDQQLAHGDDRVPVAAGHRRPVRLALPELGAGGQAAGLDPGALLDDDGVAGDGDALRGAADPLLPDHVGLGDRLARGPPSPTRPGTGSTRRWRRARRPRRRAPAATSRVRSGPSPHRTR